MKAMSNDVASDELRRLCEALGVLPRTPKPQAKSTRPIQIASFDA
jgi:hypothetical protein